MGRTTIEWTDATWNPVTGCTKVSAGCAHCYAERQFPRCYGDRPFGEVRCHEDRLDQPLRWRKPRRIFVCSMGDLFHEDVPDAGLFLIFGIMASAADHTFQVLTKRPERMREWVRGHRWVGGICPLEISGRPHLLTAAPVQRDGAAEECAKTHGTLLDEGWVPPNVWLGVSAEDQAAADERIPVLLSTPAAVRFVSVEPMLGPVDLTDVDAGSDVIGPKNDPFWDGADWRPAHLDWVICGGESGPRARPMHPDWARSLRDQCVAAGVAFHFKQWGEWAPATEEFGVTGHVMPETGERYTWVGIDGRTQNPSWHGLGESAFAMARVGKKAAGRELDCRTWDEFPETR